MRSIFCFFNVKLALLLVSSLRVGSYVPVHAQEPAKSSVDASSLELLEEEQSAFQAAVAIAQPSVVQIETFGGLERIGAELVAEGPTTGLIVSEDGWVVSSLFSFRAQPASILVSLPNGKRAAAKIVARDFSRELVLLKVDDVADLPTPTVCPIKDVKVGQWSIALGKTYDKNSVSQSAGIISALGRAYEKAIQSDAKISPVNYGGPLIDLEGRVIGILAPISPGAFLEGDSSQLYDSGIGFAIPLQDVLDRLPKLQKGENIRPGKLGIVATDQNEMAGPVRIAGATPGSPAAKAGVRAKDQLIEVNGRRISILAELRHALGPADAGSNIPLAVSRNGKRLEMQCTLAEDIPTYRQRFLGVRVKEVDGRVEITRIEDSSPAKNVGLKVGDVIEKVDGEPIKNRKDLRRMIAVAELDKALKITLASGDAQRDVDITAVVWPKALPLELPPAFPSADDSMVCEIVDLTLGDFPNKAFAIVPPLAQARELGVLVMFPEPGEVDRAKIQQLFSEFSREQGWIIAVIPSRNATEWNREEVELAGRSLGRLENAYKLDSTRLVIGGIGIGGRLAIAAAAMDRQRVSGTLVIGTQVSNLGLRSENAPLQSLQFLFVGKQDELQEPVGRIEANGFSANILSMNEFTPGKWEMIPLEPITRWLEGLGRL